MSNHSMPQVRLPSPMFYAPSSTKLSHVTVLPQNNGQAIPQHLPQSNIHIVTIILCRGKLLYTQPDKDSTYKKPLNSVHPVLLNIHSHEQDPPINGKLLRLIDFAWAFLRVYAPSLEPAFLCT